MAGSYFHRSERYASGNSSLVLVEADGAFGGADLNFLSGVYPFSLFERNLVVSLSYQRLFDFRRNLEYQLTWGGILDQVSFRQQGGLAAVSPALAVQVTPWLSLGATINIWIDELGGSQTFSRELSQYGSDGTSRTIEEKFRNASGLNATFGVLAHPMEKLTLGASLDLPFRLRLDLDRTVESRTLSPDRSVVRVQQERLPLDFPISFNLGAAWRFSDNLNAALEYSFTDWGGFRTQSAFGSFGGEVNAITGESGSAAATQSVRLGGEYLWVLETITIPLRAGLGYDPQPAGDQSETYWTVALGSGLGYGRIILDLAYQLRFGLGVQQGVLRAIPGADADVFQHSVMLSLIVHLS